MADELFQLYQDVVLEHNRHPRNYVVLEAATHHGRGYNPLCGDRIELMLDVDDSGVIRAVGFQGDSCAIATASASLLTEVLQDATLARARELMAAFRSTLAGEPQPLPEALEPLRAVRQFPSRIKCANLPWASLEAALAGDEVASTEEPFRHGT
ncbi:SUF system NifU family Fe-S cluster assembly protein [Aquisalimonas lutea]|uniref:Fe-S cluster assembly sulfur transfer protein SufU n=1 Tax=Aquisalimonas lutea TaxID=1327750 RepID=UPI0025B4DE40|nr:SUF system NifU family Fe-S cluster assembly protein [Aquisalimonas lutea]MDN3519648.1 SUF system NifU family Fe-S cluster assembly protein [Aquisalimonas lutea]